MFLMCALGFPDLRASTRLHNVDDLRTQLWLRQVGAVQGLAGDGGGGGSSLQTAQTRPSKQVRVHVSGTIPLCVFWTDVFVLHFENNPVPAQYLRETEFALSAGCLRDKGSRTLASYRGRAGLIGVIVLKEEC